MRRLPTSADAKGSSFTIADFLEIGGDELSLELLAGREYLSHEVGEPATNRPGLAMTGFYDDFASDRLQLMGKPEISYLRSLDEARRYASFDELVRRGAYCFIFTNGDLPDDDFIDHARDSHAVLLASSLLTRTFSHRAAYILERLAAPKTTIYGTMVEVDGIGVLFEGDPGLGKSETALGLIKRGASLIADDLTCIRREFGANVLYGSAAESTAGFMEIRGIGIMDIQRIFGINSVRGEKRLELVITFKQMHDVRADIDRIGQVRRYRRILDVEIPNMVIPVSAGRDLVNLVETAAQQQKILLSGYDPVNALSERLRTRIDAQVVLADDKRKGN